MTWVRGNPPENVLPSDVTSYKEAYLKLYMDIERELYSAYAEKEINEETYGKKCDALDEINREIMSIISKKETVPVPPPLDAIMKMLRDREKGGGGGGFIIFGGNFP